MEAASTTSLRCRSISRGTNSCPTTISAPPSATTTPYADGPRPSARMASGMMVDVCMVSTASTKVSPTKTRKVRSVSAVCRPGRRVRTDLGAAPVAGGRAGRWPGQPQGFGHLPGDHGGGGQCGARVDQEQRGEARLGQHPGEQRGDSHAQVERPELKVERARAALGGHHVDDRRDERRAGHRVDHADQRGEHRDQQQGSAEGERHHQADRGQVRGEQRRPASPPVGEHPAEQHAGRSAGPVRADHGAGQPVARAAYVGEVEREEQHGEARRPG